MRIVKFDDALRTGLCGEQSMQSRLCVLSTSTTLILFSTQCSSLSSN